MDSQALEAAKSVETWLPFLTSRASVVGGITLIVIILGALPSVLAMSEKKWMKIVTASIAAALSVLTGVKTQMLHADKESFEALALEARVLIHNVRKDAKNLQETRAANDGGLGPAEADEFKSTFAKHMAAFSSLNERGKRIGLLLLDGSPSQASLRPALLTVQAAQASKTSSTYRGTAIGRCSTTFAAREYARYEARRRIALLIDPSANGERLDSVLQGIEGSVRDTGSQLVREPNGLIAHTATADMDRAFAYPKYLRLDSWRRPPVQWTANSVLPPGYAGRLAVGGGGLDGQFTFHLNFERIGAATRVSVAEIQVAQDGSGGSTRWFFEVQIGGRRVIWIPTRRYDDGGHPTRCLPSADEGLSGEVPALSGPLPIRILGFKPKDL